MGRSLHNKIYLGRQALLLNIERVQVVASCVAALAVGGIALSMVNNLF